VWERREDRVRLRNSMMLCSVCSQQHEHNGDNEPEQLDKRSGIKFCFIAQQPPPDMKDKGEYCTDSQTAHGQKDTSYN